MAIPACSGGSPGSDASPSGAAGLRVRPRDATQLDPLMKLTASDEQAGDQFAFAAAMSGDVAAIGAMGDDDAGGNAGAAYVFTRSGARWVQTAKLHSSDGHGNDDFGAAIAIDGTTIVVGAPDAETPTSDAGAAYVFVLSGGAWIEQAKLVASDGFSEQQLGSAVALSGDTAVLGTIHDGGGALYVFVRSGTTWTQQAKLTAADGAPGDQLGVSVAIAGDTVLAGAPGGGGVGAAYVFTRSGTTWTQQAKLTGAGSQAGDAFGFSVALSGDTALIGANVADNENGSDAGAAYVFVRAAGAWSPQARLLAADGRGGDHLGGAVALQGDVALVGAALNSNLGAEAGAAYLFTRSNGAWSQSAELTGSGEQSADFFGFPVVLSGDFALVGATGDDTRGDFAGAAYLFGPPPAPGNNGEVCASDAACSSGFCVDGVCCDTPCGEGDATTCMACSVAAGGAVDGTCGPRTAGTVCRGAAGACDAAETCDGVSMACPADQVTAAGALCRGAAGACDVAERCDGVSPACPADRLAPAGTTCRPAGGSCDIAEKCLGSSPLCPPDAFKPPLSLCSGVLGLPGLCLGNTCVL
ncbi:MAG TPA: hypothetical protein VFP84_11955 [Kofleriaceae bacterium]|nr:hypothetical protein [Kofleriaceae bacterium]